MRTEVIQCDNCKKQTFDIYSEIGWIYIGTLNESDTQIMLMGGREEITKVCKSIQHFGKGFHFCSKKCLNIFIEKDIK